MTLKHGDWAVSGGRYRIGSLWGIRICKFLYLWQPFRRLYNSLLSKIGSLLFWLRQICFEWFEWLAQIQLLKIIFLVYHICDFCFDDWACFFSTRIEGIERVISTCNQWRVLLTDICYDTWIIQTFWNGGSIGIQLLIDWDNGDFLGGVKAIFLLVTRAVKFQH